MGSTDPADVVGDERYGWWSKANFDFNGRYLVYYKLQTKEEIATGVPRKEVRVTGVTPTPIKGKVGYKWKDCKSRGRLSTFVRIIDPRYKPRKEEAYDLSTPTPKRRKPRVTGT